MKASVIVKDEDNTKGCKFVIDAREAHSGGETAFSIEEPILNDFPFQQFQCFSPLIKFEKEMCGLCGEVLLCSNVGVRADAAELGGEFEVVGNEIEFLEVWIAGCLTSAPEYLKIPESDFVFESGASR